MLMKISKIIALPLMLLVSACGGGGKFDGKWIADADMTIEKAKVLNGGELEGYELRAVNEMVGALSSILISENKFAFSANKKLVNCEISDNDIATCVMPEKEEPLYINMSFAGDGDEKRLVLGIENASMYLKAE